MILAVGTHSFLIVVRLNDVWDICDFRVLDTGHYYGMGIPKDTRGTFLARRRTSIDRDAAQTICRFEARAPYRKLGEIPILEDSADIHQLTCANGGIYVANTGRNCVFYQSLDGQTVHTYHFDALHRDRHHVNSVFPCGKEIIVLLNNMGRSICSELAILHHDLQAGLRLGRTVRLWHMGAHNVFVDSPLLFYNASGDGELVVVDLVKGLVVKTLRFPGHTKGLSAIREHIVIGFSDFADGPARNRTRGSLAIMDRQSLKEVTRIDLNHSSLAQPVGNVNAVRCLSSRDDSFGLPCSTGIDWDHLRLAEG